jgi:predicted XRE-type DNA-binding protein
MKEIKDLQDIQALEKLSNEYEFENALLIDRKLRLMIKENPGLVSVRDKVRALITEYEERVWANPSSISNAQIKESDTAELLIENERKFLMRRKETIRKKLNEFDMNQQDLGTLLGHPKSYMSELMNGVTQFSLKDLVIIHRVFGIGLKILIPTHLQVDTTDKINKIISKLNNPKLKRRKKNLLLNEA